MFKTIEKTGAVSDIVSKSFSDFVRYASSSLRDRYTTIDEMLQDFNSIWKDYIQGMQDNYNRFYKTDLSKRPSAFGIEIVGATEEGDIVNEIGNPNIPDEDTGSVSEDEDQFATPEETQGSKVNVNDVFNDEEGKAVTPQ